MVYVTYTTTPRSEWRRSALQAAHSRYRLRFGYRHLGTTATLALAIGGAGLYAFTSLGGPSQDHRGDGATLSFSQTADANGHSPIEHVLGSGFQPPGAEPEIGAKQPLLLSLSTFDLVPGQFSGVSSSIENPPAATRAEPPVKPARLALSPATSKARRRPADVSHIAIRLPAGGSLDDGTAPGASNLQAAPSGAADSFGEAFAESDSSASLSRPDAAQRIELAEGGVGASPFSLELAGTAEALAPPAEAAGQSGSGAALPVETTGSTIPEPTARPGKEPEPAASLAPDAEEFASTPAIPGTANPISARAENGIEARAEDRLTAADGSEPEARVLAESAIPRRIARAESPAPVSNVRMIAGVNTGGNAGANAGANGRSDEIAAFTQTFPMIEVAGDKLGAITMRDFGANRQAVHLGTLLSLFRLKMHPAEFARLNASPAAAQYISLESLSQAGFAVDYDARKGILHLDTER